MNKYLYCIILGIIIFLLLNRYNGFNVGCPGEGDPCDESLDGQCEEHLTCVDGTCRSAAGGGRGGGGAAPKDACAAGTEPIDPTIPHIDLINIVEDNSWFDWFSNPPFEDDYIGQHQPRHKVDNFADLPCKLKVKDDSPLRARSLPLKYVSIISSGGDSGVVYKYSTHLRHEGQGDYVTVAVKKFLDQTDPEINIVLSMEEVALNEGINSCDIIDARILLVGTRPLRKYVCIMEYMDGTLLNLIFDNDLDVNQFKYIIKMIAIAFRCISNAGYCYTDLKPSNILFKKNFDVLTYRLGDIGSIVRNTTIGYHPSTYPPPEYEIGRNLNNNDNVMIWSIGVLIARLYKFGRKEFRNEEYRDLTDTQSDYYLTNQQLLDYYYGTLIPDIISKINSIPDCTIIDPKMKEILNGTLTSPEQRINFDRIIELTN